MTPPSSRSVPAGPGPAHGALAAAGRLLRLELKRNAVPWVLPLLAAVFYFDTLRTADGFAPVWTQRASVDRRPHAGRCSACSRPGWPPGQARARAAGRRSTWSAPAAGGLGAAVRRPGRNAGLAAAGVPRRGRGDLQPDRAAGDLGRPAAVAGARRRGLRDRGDRASGSPPGCSFPGGSPRRWPRSPRSRHSRPASARYWASRRRPARTRCCHRAAPRRRSTRAPTTTSRRTSRSCRSCSWPGSRSRCSACSAWRRGCASSASGGGRAALRAVARPG